MSEATKAVTKFHSFIKDDDDKKRVSQSEKAGITFPIGRIARYMKEGGYAKRIGGGAPIYMSCILEYLSAELLELAGNSAKENKKSRIVPRHILLAIKNDDEFHSLLPLAIIPNAGTNPNILNEILPTKFKRK